MGKNATGFLKGATILTAAGILSRLLGVFYKVPLYALVGNYGNGLISNATTIYTVLLMVSTVGVPVAISKMISESLAADDYRRVQSVFKISSLLLITVGGLATAFLFFGGRWLIGLAGWEEETYAALMAIAPLPLIISICSTFRGYFQGFQIMVPTAVSQIFEQLVRVVAGTLLCWLCISRGLGVGMASGGAVMGSTLGGVVAVVILLFFYRSFRPEVKEKLALQPEMAALNDKSILKRLVLIAIPVTLTSAIVAVFSLIDSMIYVGRLSLAGVDAVTATSMWGDLANADTLINIPLVISGNLAVAMIPAISQSFAVRDRRGVQEKIDVAIRVILLVALPICFGLSALAQPIFDILFPASPYGPGILSTYAFATIFMMLSNTFQSILQSIDRFRVPLINLGAAVIIRFLTAYIFMAIPALNIYGIVLSNIITFGFLTVVNYYFVKEFTKIKMNWKKAAAKPLFASVIMAFAVVGAYTLLKLPLGDLIYSRLGALLAIVIGLVIGVATYGIITILIGGISESEIAFLPMSGRIMPAYRRLSAFLGLAKKPRSKAPSSHRDESAEETKRSRPVADKTGIPQEPVKETRPPAPPAEFSITEAEDEPGPSVETGTTVEKLTRKPIIRRKKPSRPVAEAEDEKKTPSPNLRPRKKQPKPGEWDPHKVEEEEENKRWKGRK